VPVVRGPPDPSKTAIGVPSCRGPNWPLPIRHWSPWTGPTYGPELVPSPPHPSHAHLRRPCHPRRAFLHFSPAMVTPRASTETSAATGVREHQRQGWNHWSALGPYRIGHVGIPAGASGDHEYKEPQVIESARPGPRPLEHGGSGFEPHLTAAAGQRPLPTRQASPRTGLTLPPRWCNRCRARAMFTLSGRAPDVPYASVHSGHSRTITVDEHAGRAVGSLHTERSEGASKARGAMLTLLEVTASPRPPGQLRSAGRW
jgi:hypothetical protein